MSLNRRKTRRDDGPWNPRFQTIKGYGREGSGSRSFLRCKIHYNKKIGRDVQFDELVNKYDAVYIAIGNWKPSNTRTPGVDLKGVYHALDFLGQVNYGKRIEVGETVAIIGGGFTAFDAARISLRLGAKKS